MAEKGIPAKFLHLLALVRNDDIETIQSLFEGKSADYVVWMLSVVYSNSDVIDDNHQHVSINEIGRKSHDPLSALHLAAKCGSRDVLKLIISFGVDVNLQTIHERLTPLHFAAHEGNITVARYLLSAGADIDQTDIYGRSPLHLAVSRGFIHITRFLIVRGAAISLVSGVEDLGRNVLHKAVRKGYIQVAELIVRSADVCGKTGELINEHTKLQVRSFINLAQKSDGQTPLHLAAALGETRIIGTLLTQGADANIRDNNGHTAISILMQTKGGISSGRKECCTLLIQRCDVNIRDHMGLSPLHFAVYMNRPFQVKVLLSAGAEIECHGDFGCSPLHYAFLNPLMVCAKVAPILIDKGANVNVMDNEGRTPLHLVAQHENPPPPIVEKLTHHGADVNSKDNEGRTPLHILCTILPSSTTKLLVAEGANINMPDNNGDTPLHIMVKSMFTSQEAALDLINLGAHVNARNLQGQTPLHLSASRESIELLVTLLKSGADVNMADIEGQTSLHLAASSDRKCDLPVIKTLLKYGAKVNSCRRDGCTPLILLIKSGWSTMPVVKLLIRNGASVNALDDNGRNALHNSCQEGNLTLAKCLVDAGIKCDIIDNWGKTALSLSNSVQLVGFLAKHTRRVSV